MTSQIYYERHFLQSLMARWPRRGRSLVQLGCGEGEVLEHFWESGFDVTGVDGEHDKLEAAKERMGHRAVWHLGPYDATPFDDNEFDYVAVYHALEGKERAAQDAILREALRLATRGVVIVVDNPWSLVHWNGKHAVNVFRLWRMCRRLVPSALMTWGAALHGPRWTWSSSWKWPWHWNVFAGGKDANARLLFDALNQGYRYSPLGASLFVRLDLGQGRAVTPLLLRTQERVRATTIHAYPPTVLGQGDGPQVSTFTKENTTNKH